jgi:Tfp pilus assembly protein PilF/peroxiredoxin
MEYSGNSSTVKSSCFRIINLFLKAVFFNAVFLIGLAGALNAEALLQINDPAPEFSLNDLDAKEVKLSQFSNKKAVVVVFWSTWSANSQRALKRFDEYYRKYKDREIQVLGINVENQTISPEDLAGIKKFAEEIKISFPLLIDKNLETFHAYNIIAIPSTVVVSGGKVTYAMPGLPLVQTEDLFDYLLILAGETPFKKVEQKYTPKPAAVADAGLARQYVAKKVNAMAYPFFQKAIEKDPSYIAPYVELARLYSSEGKNTEAEETLRKAVANDSENTAALSELGYLLAKKGTLKEAIDMLNTAVKKETYTPAFYYLGYALFKNNQTKEAVQSFDKALSMNPYDPSLFIIRAELYESSKMTKEASSDYKKALELLLKIRN